ncbi:MAG: HAD family hydrolase [Bdellovibrionales bacterium]
MKSKIQLVMFDFDGTLVDTAPDLIRATNRFLESKGVEALPESRIRREIGRGLKRLLAQVVPDELKKEENLPQLEKEFLEVYDQEVLNTPVLYEGALEFLEEYEGRIAILSNKRERFIKKILGHLGLDRLPWVGVIGGDTLANMKPHPEPFLHVLALAGLDPEEAVIVGDGQPDVVGALGVGMRSIAVDFGYTSSEELMGLGATYAIESFHELFPLLKSIT